jgi:hypothetical protein
MCRGNELRFAQDATWVHGPNTRRNNATAWLGVGQHTTARIPGTNTPLPVPMVMVYADRDILVGKEVQFSWGQETWRRHQQIQVSPLYHPPLSMSSSNGAVVVGATHVMNHH